MRHNSNDLFLLLALLAIILIYGWSYWLIFLQVKDDDHLRFEDHEPEQQETSRKHVIIYNRPHGVTNSSQANPVPLKLNQDLTEYLRFPTRAKPFNFSSCTMTNCFDSSRCSPSGPIRIHIKASKSTSERLPIREASGLNNIIHRSILQIIRKSAHYEPDPDKACLFIPQEDTLDRDPLSQSFTPNLVNLFGPDNNYGMNNLVFNLYSGSWPDYHEYDFAGLDINAAILAKASLSRKFHRPQYDISLPLFSHLHPVNELSQTRDVIEQPENLNKTIFLSFKGKRYVLGRGSETRNLLYHLHNDRDVIMLSTCKHGKKWQDNVDDRCSIDEEYYNKYDFLDLMKKSVFCLTPRGRRLGSYRFLEALQYGCIPVILSDGWVMPFDEKINWNQASIQFDEKSILFVPDLLRDIGRSEIDRLRRMGRSLYGEHLSTVERIVMQTISIIEARVHNLLSLRVD